MDNFLISPPPPTIYGRALIRGCRLFTFLLLGAGGDLLDGVLENGGRLLENLPCIIFC